MFQNRFLIIGQLFSELDQRILERLHPSMFCLGQYLLTLLITLKK